MLQHGEVNPLNVHGLRQIDHCPPHFEQVVFDLHVEVQKITDWIYTNCASRFYFGDKILIKEDGRRDMCKVVAFENHSEASYFGLFLDKINTQTNNVW